MAAHSALSSRSLIPPPHSRRSFLLWPDLVERVPFEQLSILHHVVDRIGVPNVIQRVLRQHDQVGELSYFDAPQILGVANRFRTV